MLPKRLERKQIHKNPWFTLYMDKIQLNSGKILPDYYVVERADFVIVIVTNEKQEVLFVKSPRFVVNRMEWELPMGAVDPGENEIQAAAREVQEETGYTLKELKKVYEYHPSNATVSQKAIVFTAQVTNESQQDYDKEEVEEVKWLSKEEVNDLILNNKTMDGNSILPLLLHMRSWQE